MSEAEADDSGSGPPGRSAVSALPKSEGGEADENPDGARLEALLAAADERLAHNRERSGRQHVRLQPSLARLDEQQKARRGSKEVLRLAELPAPPDLDPVRMWEAIEAAFRVSDLRAKTAKATSRADVEAVVAVQKAARALARASAELFKHGAPSDFAIARRLLLLGKAGMPNLAAKTLDFLLFCPDGAAALADAAKEAEADLTAVRRSGAVWPYAKGEPAVAWLLTEGLPDVFVRFLGGEKTFTEDSATARRSDCVRFIQAAHVAMGREQPTDVAAVKTVKRARKASAKGTRTAKSNRRVPVT